MTKKKKKKKEPSPLDAVTVTVTMAGVPVFVHVDAGLGRPLSAWGHIDPSSSSASERAVAMAVHRTLETATLNAQQAQRQGATAESARTRAEDAAKHWTNKWLKKAHAAHPRYGRERLAHAARRLAADRKIKGKLKPVPPGKRDEITEGRAQQFLDRLRQHA